LFVVVIHQLHSHQHRTTSFTALDHD